jgi:hypothetical protein
MLAAHTWRNSCLCFNSNPICAPNYFAWEKPWAFALPDWSCFVQIDLETIQHVQQRKITRFASCECLPCIVQLMGSILSDVMAWYHVYVTRDISFYGSLSLIDQKPLKPINVSKSIHEIFLKMVKQHLFLDPHDLFFLNKKFNLVLLRFLLMSLLTVQDRSWEYSLMK